MKKSCDNCSDINCKRDSESKRCYENLENWKPIKKCQINVFERKDFGCQFECVRGYYCIQYR